MATPTPWSMDCCQAQLGGVSMPLSPQGPFQLSPNWLEGCPSMRPVSTKSMSHPPVILLLGLNASLAGFGKEELLGRSVFTRRRKCRL